MPTTFEIEIIETTPQDYTIFDRSNTEGEEIYVIDHYNKIAKIDTKGIRFKMPLIPFDYKFISSMNQIMIDRYESGSMFKMIVEKEGRVGFFAIIHID